MIGYVKCFESNKKMSFKISANKLLKKNTQIWKKVTNLLSIKLDTNVHGLKSTKRICLIQVFVINNARFYCESKEEVLSSNIFGRMQIWNKKTQNAELY